MKIHPLLTDDAILAEIGHRIQAARLKANITQAALADQAGVSTPTVQRIETGASAQFISVLRVLRALGLADRIDLLVDPPDVRPLDMVAQAPKARQRASGATTPEPAPWTWGDER